MSETLYAIAERYREVLNMEAANEDERAALVNALDSMDGEFSDKVENVIRFIRNTEADAASIREEEKRLADRRQALSRKAENLTAYIESMMNLTGKRELSAGIFVAKFKMNPPSISVLDESVIPREYFIEQAPQLSKQAIKDAIKAGAVVPGIEVVRNERLEIR